MKNKPTVKEEVTYTVEVWRCTRERYRDTFPSKSKAQGFIRRQKNRLARQAQYDQSRYQCWNEPAKLLINRTRSETVETEL